MQEIGNIEMLQVQAGSLKVERNGIKSYDPALLQSVDSIRLEAGGAVALCGGELLDVHHADHPQTKNRANQNAISIGFTGQYAAMRARFGSHLTNGCAGENILIGADRLLSAAELERDLVIVNQKNEQFRLTGLLCAAPCEPFSRFALGIDAEHSRTQMKRTLQFLDDGMRGFYAHLGGAGGIVAVGDRCYLVDAS